MFISIIDKIFRMSKTTVEYFINKLGQKFQHTTRRNNPLTHLEHILCPLHCLGSGSQKSYE